MTDDKTPTVSPAQQEAHARKLNAEADLALAELLIREQELRSMTANAERAEQIGEIEAKKHELYGASDHEHRTIRFLGTVNDASVKATVEKLVTFHRIDPGCEITMVINSHGGEITGGFHLFDTMLWMRDRGHKITTIANGMAASMGGVLLQAGTKRVMTPDASMLIHEASFGAGGSMGTVEDQVEYVKMLQGRILMILAERSTLNERQIKARWKRKNWWLMAPEALQLGFVDVIR